jgi:hypothetical protein
LVLSPPGAPATGGVVEVVAIPVDVEVAAVDVVATSVDVVSSRWSLWST